MIQATFTVSGSDFNADIFEQIKAFINSKGQDFEVVVKIKTKESREEMRSRIEQSAAEMERGENTVFFTGEEFENFLEQRSTK